VLRTNYTVRQFSYNNINCDWDLLNKTLSMPIKCRLRASRGAWQFSYRNHQTRQWFSSDVARHCQWFGVSGCSFQTFVAHFTTKVGKVRSATTEASPPVINVRQSTTLADLVPVSVDEAAKLLQSAPNKNCQLDPIPTWIRKKSADRFAPLFLCGTLQLFLFHWSATLSETCLGISSRQLHYSTKISSWACGVHGLHWGRHGSVKSTQGQLPHVRWWSTNLYAH